MDNKFINLPTTYTQICAFKAPLEVLNKILSELKNNGFEVMEIKAEDNSCEIVIPSDSKVIGYSYEPNLFGEGIGNLDFITTQSQDLHHVKMQEFISSHTPETIFATEQYVGDYGLAVEITVSKSGETVKRYNSDEIFDNSSNI
jgi:hypothetical protein